MRAVQISSARRSPMVRAFAFAMGALNSTYDNDNDDNNSNNDNAFAKPPQQTGPRSVADESRKPAGRGQGRRGAEAGAWRDPEKLLLFK